MSRVTILLTMLLALFQPVAFARSAGQDALDRGAAHYRAGAFDAAAREFRAATEADPGLLPAWINLGWAYRRLQRNDAALRAWDIVLKIEPAHPELYNERAAIHIDRQDFHAAVAEYRRSLSHDPAQAEVRLRLGDLCRQTGRDDDALAAYETLLARPDYRVRALARILDLFEANRDIERALAYADARAAIVVTDAALRARVARLHTARGDAAYARGDFAPAQRHYGQAVNLDPDNAQAYANLGWALRRQDKTTEALVAWNRAVQLDASLSRLAVPIAEAYEQTGDVARATEWYRTAQRPGADGAATAAFRLGVLALRAARADEAAHWFDTLLAAARADDAWPPKIANAYIEHERIGDGVKFFEARARDTAPPNRALGTLYAAKGAQSFRTGQYAASADALRLALRHQPDAPTLWRDLGLALCRDQQWNECEQAWRRYATAAPDSTAPLNLLARLYYQRRQYGDMIRVARRSLDLQPEQPSLQLDLAKALLFDNQFAASRALSEQLAAAYPDDVAIQSFWGETLVRHRDDARARQLWTRLLKANTDPARRDYFRYKWLQATYHGGDYERAVSTLRGWAREKPVPQFVYTYLAEDALFRDDKTEAAQWYETLLGDYPDNIATWLVLSQLYADLGDVQRRRATLERARARFPERIEIQLEIADNELAAGRPDHAFKIYSQVWLQRATNRRAYLGMIHALLAQGRDGEARDLLQRNRDPFLSEFELALLNGRVLASAGQHGAAESYLKQVTAGSDGGTYVPILLYHGLVEGPRDKNLSIANFESQLRALRDAGYTTLTIAELDRVLRGERALPAKPVVITFDDARIDAFRAADPLLEKYGMTATMFVPTALTLDDHPFYADWALLRRYAATGRWDFQSHGHRAHHRVPINSGGELGGFLVNREWLADEARPETYEEFSARIDADYRTSARLLAQHLPGTRLVGYAFPYSEAGQGDTGNEPRAGELNEKIVFEQFGFGFVQDGSGYNLIRPGDTKPRLLRRLNVPRDWDGERLLGHLLGKNPPALARIAMGQSLHWQGQHQAARDLFESLVERDARYLPGGAIHLASIAYDQGRYRDAERYLAQATLAPPAASERLKERLAWKNRSTAGNDFSYTSDSDRRLLVADHLRLRIPFSIPVDVWMRAGATRLDESGYDAIQSRDLYLGSAWSFTDRLNVELEGRQRSAPELDTAYSGWLRAAWIADGWTLNFSSGFEDVETAAARMAGIQSRNVALNLTGKTFGRWNYRAATTRSAYTDDNERLDMRLRLTYQFESAWQAGVERRYSDTTRIAAQYYSPQELETTQLVLRYAGRGTGGSTTALDLGYGRASDALHDARWAAHAALNFVHHWNARFRTRVSALHDRLPDYYNSRMDVGIDVRF